MKPAQKEWRQRYKKQVAKLQNEYYHRNKHNINIQRREIQQRRSVEEKLELVNTAIRNRRIRRAKMRHLMNELKIKRGGKCKICGYNNDLRALIWHHRDPSTKLYNMANLLSSANKFKLAIEESKKCDLICANCHTIMEHEI